MTPGSLCQRPRPLLLPELSGPAEDSHSIARFSGPIPYNPEVAQSTKFANWRGGDVDDDSEQPPAAAPNNDEEEARARQRLFKP